MKVLIAAILMALMIFLFSACSLPGFSTETSTQSQGSSQVSNPEDETVSMDQSSSMADSSDTGALPDEAAANTKLVKVVLFFATEDKGALIEEEREIQVTDGAILKACINAMIEGPITQSLSKTIPEGTVLRGISIKDKVATVDLSKEFEQADGVAGNAAKMSIVNTLTRINGIEKVRFHIGGEEMAGPDGMPVGEISPALLEADGTFVNQ